MNRVVFTVIAAGLVACDHAPTAPQNGARGAHIQYGHTVTGSLTAPDSAFYYIDATAGDLLAVYATSSDSTIIIGFGDSGTTNPNLYAVHGGSLAGSTALFSYLVPQTGAFVVSVVRPAASGPAYLSHPASFDLEVVNVYIGPEHLKPAIALGQVVSGESIDSVGDIDVFTFTGTKGQAIVGYVLATGTAPSQGVSMTFYPTDPDSILETIGSRVGDTALENQFTTSYVLPSTGTYHVKLQALDGSDYVGPYEFEVYPIDSAPESISPNVVPGDTVHGESIDHTGDVDIFTVKATAGTAANLFAQVVGSATNIFEFDVQDLSGHQLATIIPPNGAALTDGPGSGVFSVPANGQFRIVVRGIGDGRGPYRFFVYPINPAPEIAPATFNPGDSVTTETIGLPGDADNFTMHIASGSLANICETVGSAQVTVLSPSNAPVGLEANNPPCTGGFGVTPGNYVVSVADGPGSSFRGPYTLKSWTYSYAPEHVSPVITLGDTVTGESIDAPGDIDTFTFQAHRFELVGITVTSSSPNVAPSWFLSIPNQSLPIYAGYGTLGASGRVDLDSAGTYPFVVQGGGLPSNIGPYRFVFTPWPTAPEHHAATVALGTSITDESIDFKDDVDQFTLTAPAGTLGIIAVTEASPALVQAMVMPTDSTLLTWANGSNGYTGYSQRFAIPASGSVLLRMTGQWPGAPMPYSVATTVVNPAPEHVPSAVTIGDTITGESIDYIGDLDQFTFSGTAGQQIVVNFQTPQGAGQGTMVLQLLGPDGSALGQVVSSFNSTPLTTGTITLPTTGTYTIAVSGADNGASPAVGPYVFAVVPAS